MRRYLLVLDMDLLAFDEELGQQPIGYLLARPEQDQEPAEVVVLSLPVTGKASSLELLLGAAATVHMPVPAKLPIAPRPDHDAGVAAEHRTNRAVRQLKAIGCQASGVIRDEELVKAVRAETRAPLRRGDLGDRQAKRQQAGAHPASGPGSSAAAPLGPAAGPLYIRPGHQAE